MFKHLEFTKKDKKIMDGKTGRTDKVSFELVFNSHKKAVRKSKIS